MPYLMTVYTPLRPLKSLFGVLLRFRVNNVTVIDDLEKVFLRISLHPENRDVVRFLWFKNINDIDLTYFNENEFIEFGFTHVLFGLVSYPLFGNPD